MATAPFIELRHVSKSYVSASSVVNAVCDAHLVVDRGEFVVIAAHPGSGKTTLLNLIAGLTLPSEGKVLYDGVEVWRLPDPQRSLFRTAHVGFVFQFPTLMPSLTALENVLLSMTLHRMNEDAGERTRWAMELLGEVGLGERLGAYPRQLAGVDQQRLVIARALVRRPEVLLADEPTAGLCEQGVDEILALLRHYQRSASLTVVLATAKDTPIRHEGRTLTLAAGRLIELPPIGEPSHD